MSCRDFSALVMLLSVSKSGSSLRQSAEDGLAGRLGIERGVGGVEHGEILRSIFANAVDCRAVDILGALAQAAVIGADQFLYPMILKFWAGNVDQPGRADATKTDAGEKFLNLVLGFADSVGLDHGAKVGNFVGEVAVTVLRGVLAVVLVEDQEILGHLSAPFSMLQS